LILMTGQLIIMTVSCDVRSGSMPSYYIRTFTILEIPYILCMTKTYKSIESKSSSPIIIIQEGRKVTRYLQKGASEVAGPCNVHPRQIGRIEGQKYV
jgi:hypothetical protein